MLYIRGKKERKKEEEKKKNFPNIYSKIT